MIAPPRRFPGRASTGGLRHPGTPASRTRRGLLGARIALAWIFIYHGAGTLFGAFGGAGIHEASKFYGTVAHLHPATFFAVLGGIIECFGGAAVGLGIFGRIAALGLTGDMIIAMATVTFRNGIVSNAPGARLRAQLWPSPPWRSWWLLLGTGYLFPRRGASTHARGAPAPGVPSVSADLTRRPD